MTLLIKKAIFILRGEEVSKNTVVYPVRLKLEILEAVRKAVQVKEKAEGFPVTMTDFINRAIFKEAKKFTKGVKV